MGNHASDIGGFWRIENRPISHVGVVPYLGKTIDFRKDPKTGKPLFGLDPKKIYDEEIAHFANLLGKKKVVLLCYESAEKFCHRHLVADWLNDAHPWGDAAERVDEIALSELAPTA